MISSPAGNNIQSLQEISEKPPSKYSHHIEIKRNLGGTGLPLPRTFTVNSTGYFGFVFRFCINCSVPCASFPLSLACGRGWYSVSALAFLRDYSRNLPHSKYSHLFKAFLIMPSISKCIGPSCLTLAC